MEKIYHQYQKGTTQSNICLVFLHEGLGSVETWKDYPESLHTKTGMSTLVYDRAGYGKSAGSLINRPLNYLNIASIELQRLLQFLKIEKVVLYGHSDGGSIALNYAAKHPQMVLGIITEAAHVIVEDITLKGIKQAVKAYDLGKLDGLQKFHKSDYHPIFEAWSNTWLNPQFKAWNLLEELTLINCPQLIIQGADDQYGTLKQIELIEKLTKGKTQTFIPKCGHAPFIEKRTQVEEKVIHFLNRYTK